MTDKTDDARGLLREAKGVIESLDAIINGEISREWADHFGKDWEDMTACLSRITALLAAPAPVPVEPERVPYTPEAWAMAEWAIPLHVHPIGVENWDVANCAGDWKPPTPDQVRGYIAQAVYKFQKENINPLNQKIDALLSRLQVVQQNEKVWRAEWQQVSETAKVLLERAEQAEKDRDICYISLQDVRRRLHEIASLVTDPRLDEKHTA